MFKFLRSQAKIFYWIIAGTFILFLFLGGMTGRGCQAPGSANIKPGVIGTVNGDQITGEQFDYAVRQQVAQMRQQAGNRDLNANQYAAANQQAWDALVRNLLIEQAVAARDIKISDDEVLDVFQNNPPAELLAQFRGEDGTVDMNAYYSALQNPENDWSRHEAYIRSLLPRQKLNDEIAAGAFVTGIAVREEYIRQTGKAVAEYMGVLFADVDPDYEPSESEISAWYNGHQDDYQAEAQYQAKVVRFAKTPSDVDTADVLSFIQEIREDIVSGRKEFAAAAAEFSEDQNSAIRGGDLGRFDRSRMVPAFSDVAFNMAVGELSEPVLTKFGYHLIEVTEVDTDAETGEVYEITARHILLKITPSLDTLDLIRESADAFAARVDGNSFVSTAEAEAMDLVAPAPFGAGRDIPGITMSLRGSNWVAAASAGEVSPLFENQEFLYMILAEESIPAGIRGLEEVRGQVTLAVRKEHNLTAAKAKLAPAVGEVQMGRTLAEVASEGELAHAITDTFTANGNVEGVGYGTDFNMAVIKAAIGELLPEIETLRGVFAAKPLWGSDIDQADFDLRSEGIHAALLQRAQGEVISAWFDEQMAAAEVVDHRHRLRQGI